MRQYDYTTYHIPHTTYIHTYLRYERNGHREAAEEVVTQVAIKGTILYYIILYYTILLCSVCSDCLFLYCYTLTILCYATVICYATLYATMCTYLRYERDSHREAAEEVVTQVAIKGTIVWTFHILYQPERCM
jgi:hypothetical protein